MTAEAVQVVSASPEQIAQAVGEVRDTAREQQIAQTMVARIVTAAVSEEIRQVVTAFVTYGTPDTVKLGEGERAGVVASYTSAFGKPPTDEQAWRDVLRVGSGLAPETKSAPREREAEKTFIKIYNRAPNRSEAMDNTAVATIAYGLRQPERDLKAETEATVTFRLTLGRVPRTASDWDTIRSLAYVGAERAPKVLDSDGDGLSNAEERKLGTNPYKADSDGDGYVDGLEVANSYNPKGQGRLVK